MTITTTRAAGYCKTLCAYLPAFGADNVIQSQ